MTSEEFKSAFKNIYEKAIVLSEETRRNGLDVLKDYINVNKPDKTDIMEFGLKLVFDKIQSHIVDSLLTNIINLENDYQKKILKTVQKTAVLAIQEGYSAILLTLLLSSYLSFDNMNENNVPDIYEEFEKKYNSIIERARFISGKTLKEGLLSLDEYIDKDKLNQRDIMELGLKLTCMGIDALVIDRILSNIINLENNKKRIILKTIQKIAVLAIHAGYDSKTLEMLLDINNCIGNVLLTSDNKMLPDKGKITKKNGIVYEGDVINGIPHGKGKITLTDGRAKEGNWKNGKFIG